MVEAMTGEDAPVSIPCKGVVQIAGDKLSALTWRVLSRDRNSLTDDPTIIRHLHDLAVLRPQIEAEATIFSAFASAALEQDRGRRRGGVSEEASAADQLAALLHTLDHDPSAFHADGDLYEVWRHKMIGRG